MFNLIQNMSVMYGNMFDMWSSCGYKMTKDLDVCMNPYGKDAYGNYRIGDNTKRKKDKDTDKYNKFNPDKLIYPDPIYKVGDVNMWCLENNEIVVGRIVKVYPARDVVSGERINRYAINVLVDGIYSNNEIYVTENMAIEGLDTDTYVDTHKISSFIPLDTNSDKPNNTDFKCDIDDLKMDINDLRTDVKSLLESQYKIEGDLMVAKQPEIGLSIDGTLTTDIKESKGRLNCIDSTVNYCVDNIDTIKEELNEVNHKTKKASKLSKLSFLSNLML